MDRVEEFITTSRRHTAFSRVTHELSPYTRYLDVKVGGSNIIEIPDFCVNTFHGWNQADIGVITYGLNPCARYTQRRLVRGALSDFMQSHSNRSIMGVIMSNGAKYHGLSGTIFNENFDILLMLTSTIEVDQGVWRVIRHNCRISPLVFQQDGIIEKTIIKKIIPFCTSHVIRSSDYPRLAEVHSRPVVGTTDRIIIDDVNKEFIRDIISPRRSEFTPEAIHSVLCAHMNEFLQ